MQQNLSQHQINSQLVLQHLGHNKEVEIIRSENQLIQEKILREESINSSSLNQPFSNQQQKHNICNQEYSLQSSNYDQLREQRQKQQENIYEQPNGKDQIIKAKLVQEEKRKAVQQHIMEQGKELQERIKYQQKIFLEEFGCLASYNHLRDSSSLAEYSSRPQNKRIVFGTSKADNQVKNPLLIPPEGQSQNNQQQHLIEQRVQSQKEQINMRNHEEEKEHNRQKFIVSEPRNVVEYDPPGPVESYDESVDGNLSYRSLHGFSKADHRRIMNAIEYRDRDNRRAVWRQQLNPRPRIIRNAGGNSMAFVEDFSWLPKNINEHRPMDVIVHEGNLNYLFLHQKDEALNASRNKLQNTVVDAKVQKMYEDIDDQEFQILRLKQLNQERIKILLQDQNQAAQDDDQN